MTKTPPLIVVSSGEPAGIGPDISLALATREFAARIAVLGDLGLLASRARALGQQRRAARVPRRSPPSAPHAAGSLHVLPLALSAPVTAGTLDTRNAAYVLAMLRRATELCVAGTAQALVTAPVQKSVITQSGVAFSGHTELLAELTGAPQPVMLLAGKSLRVALATTHLPLRAVAAALDRAKLESLIRITHRDLRRRFRIERPQRPRARLEPARRRERHDRQRGASRSSSPPCARSRQRAST